MGVVSENLDFNEIMMMLDSIPVTQENMMIVLGVIVVCGLILGLFGLKLVRVLSALTGLALGIVIGSVAAVLLDLSGVALLAVIGVCGIVFAVGGFILRKVGMFIWVLVNVTGIIGLAASRLGYIGIVIGLVVGLILAILAVIFFEPLIMIATGIVGGRFISVGVSGIIMMYTPWNATIIQIIIFVLCAVLCIFVQFALHSRKIQKHEEDIARDLREHQSREKEIEMARMFLDEED